MGFTMKSACPASAAAAGVPSGAEAGTGTPAAVAASTKPPLSCSARTSAGGMVRIRTASGTCPRRNATCIVSSETGTTSATASSATTRARSRRYKAWSSAGGVTCTLRATAREAPQRCRR